VKKLALALATPVLLFPLRALDAHATSPDHAAVERAVQDYVEGVYQVAPERIERSVSPALVKRGFYRPDGAEAYRAPGAMSYEQLHELASFWNANGQQGDDLTYEIEVLDVLDVTAAAKLSAKWGIDYMHLEKQDGTWKIVQVLWQSHPRPEGD
jgi:hypothetical protein